MEAAEGDEALQQDVLQGFCAGIPFGGRHRAGRGVAVHRLARLAIFMQLGKFFCHRVRSWPDCAQLAGSGASRCHSRKSCYLPAGLMGARISSVTTRKGTGMSIVSEFREFAIKGNVVDLAVGVIIGGAFGKIVDSIVADLIMPVIGRILGGLDFSNYFFALKDIPPGVAMTLAEVKKAGVPVFAYGNFMTIALNFLILAFIIFIMVKQINRLKKQAPAAAPAPTPEDVVVLREIRDLLKK
jgi:large conductance mechanosensitive channel